MYFEQTYLFIETSNQKSKFIVRFSIINLTHSKSILIVYTVIALAVLMTMFAVSSFDFVIKRLIIQFKY
jgi:hypothetical protein